MNDSTDDNNNDAGGKKTITLNRPGLGQGTVRQDIGRGRSKAVVVETRKRRISRPEEDKPAPAVVVKPRVEAPKPAPRAASAPSPMRKRPVVETKIRLSANEMEARRRALEGSRVREVEDRKRAEIEAVKRAEQDKLRAIEAEELARKQAEEDLRIQKEAEENKRAEDQARKKAPVKSDNETPAPVRRNTGQADAAPAKAAPRGGKPVRPEAPKPTRNARGQDDRRRGKLTLSTALNDDAGRSRSLAATRRRQEKIRRAQMEPEIREKIAREVTLPETITIQELSQRMAERSVDVIKYLMKEGQMMTAGDVIDADMAELIASEFGHTVKRVSESDVEDSIFDTKDDEGVLVPRSPVVTIMGHVDHGKTSLLDALRNANVVSGEAGGITQHIGAYQVEQDGQKITFIDTPGHAAFTAMRARGAEVTDIAILVVAADDSVMPQTIESINHAKAAGVPIIVAINKMDKPSADPQKVRTELLQHEVFVESMGGDVLEVEVSALKGTNLDKLLEAILLQSEVLDLHANADRTAEGTVVEARLDRGRGSVATVLVSKGTLHPGEIIVAGDQWGKVRALVTDKGDHVKEAGPAVPVEVLGFNGPPKAGDRFAVVENEAKAREYAEYRQRLARDKAAARQSGSRGSLEQMMTKLQVTGTSEFALLIKGDVQGSIEAIIGSLDKISTDEVAARIVHSAAGGITESDVALAEASEAPIIAFNVRASKQARDAAEAAGVEIRYYSIIYDLIDDVKSAMSGLLSPERRETFLGYAEILEVFNITKLGKVAGCRITEGKVERGSGVRLLRDNVVIHEGNLKTLKRFKDEVSEVNTGQECGMAFENYEDIREKDVIECFRVEHIERSL